MQSRVQTDDKRLLLGFLHLQEQENGTDQHGSGSNACAIETTKAQEASGKPREPGFDISLERSEPWFSAEGEVARLLEVDRRLM